MNSFRRFGQAGEGYGINKGSVVGKIWKENVLRMRHVARMCVEDYKQSNSQRSDWGVSA